jgi:hypothetical protein
MLEEHGVVDEAGGSGMPMEASVLLGVFDKSLIDGVSEFEVKGHGVVGVLWVVLGEREKYARGAGIGQGVALLPVVDAIGANLIC